MMFKQTHHNKFNAKWFIRHLQGKNFPVVPPERLVFKTGRKKIEWTRCSMLGNLNPQVTRELRFGNVHRLCELSQQLSLMLKTKKLLWSNKHSDCMHNASFTVEKVLLFGKEALLNFCWTAEIWMSSRKQKYCAFSTSFSESVQIFQRK